LLHFLAEVTPRRDPYGIFLKEEARHIDQCQDYYLFHEYLEEHNTPLYFYQFIDKAGAHHLQYLGETNFAEMLVSNFPEEVAEALMALTDDIVSMEQYMDFVRNRYFRQTLLVHDHVQLDRDLSANHNMRKLFFASRALPNTCRKKWMTRRLPFAQHRVLLLPQPTPLSRQLFWLFLIRQKPFLSKHCLKRRGPATTSR